MLLRLDFRRVELILERLLALLPRGVLIESLGVQGLLHRVVTWLALVLPDPDQTLYRRLLRRGCLLIFAEVTFTLLHRLVLIKLGKKLLVLLILWDASLLNVKSEGYVLEGVPSQGLIVPAHVVEQTTLVAQMMIVFQLGVQVDIIRRYVLPILRRSRCDIYPLKELLPLPRSELTHLVICRACLFRTRICLRGWWV